MRVRSLAVHHTSTPDPERWNDRTIRYNSFQALTSAARNYEGIAEKALETGKPEKMDRIAAFLVALKPGLTEVSPDSIMTIGEIDKIPDNLIETFALKATMRAFNQARRGVTNDTINMERLLWLPKDQLHLAASASSKGLHVGIAGGWPHHSRLVAATFALELAGHQMRLSPRDGTNSEDYLGDRAAKERLAWLNEGQDAGDNTEPYATERENYRFVLGLLEQ